MYNVTSPGYFRIHRWRISRPAFIHSWVRTGIRVRNYAIGVVCKSACVTTTTPAPILNSSVYLLRCLCPACPHHVSSWPLLTQVSWSTTSFSRCTAREASQCFAAGFRTVCSSSIGWGIKYLKWITFVTNVLLYRTEALLKPMLKFRSLVNLNSCLIYVCVLRVVLPMLAVLYWLLSCSD